jgi:hypothetical protein
MFFATVSSLIASTYRELVLLVKNKSKKELTAINKNLNIKFFRINLFFFIL